MIKDDRHYGWHETSVSAEAEAMAVATTEAELVATLRAITRRYVKVRPYFKWYDFWIGFFYQKGVPKRLYIGPLPMIGIMVEWGFMIIGPPPKHDPYI